jgi:hypothetical protein
VTPFGFPHSDISGSKLISSSPKLIAGKRVLLLFLVPSHPLHALTNFSSHIFFGLTFESLKVC